MLRIATLLMTAASALAQSPGFTSAPGDWIPSPNPPGARAATIRATQTTQTSVRLDVAIPGASFAAGDRRPCIEFVDPDGSVIERGTLRVTLISGEPRAVSAIGSGNVHASWSIRGGRGTTTDARFSAYAVTDWHDEIFHFVGTELDTFHLEIDAAYGPKLWSFVVDWTAEPNGAGAFDQRATLIEGIAVVEGLGGLFSPGTFPLGWFAGPVLLPVAIPSPPLAVGGHLLIDLARGGLFVPRSGVSLARPVVPLGLDFHWQAIAVFPPTGLPVLSLHAVRFPL